MAVSKRRALPLLIAAVSFVAALLAAPSAARATLADTLLVFGPSSTVAVLLAFPMTLLLLLPSSPYRVLALALGLLAFLVPTPVLGVLSAEVFGVQFYSTPHLVLLGVLAGLPVAFLTQTVLLGGVDARAVSQAHALGVRTRRILRNAYRRDLAQAALFSWQVTLLTVATDPGIALPFAGSSSLLASAMAHASSAPAPIDTGRHLIIVVAALCLLISAQMPRAFFVPHASFEDVRYRSSPLPVAVTAALSVLILGLVGLLLGRAVTVPAGSDAVPTLAATLLTAIPALFLSFPVALVIAYWFRHREVTTFLPMLLLLGALSVGGPLLARAFLAPIRIGGATVLSALVGGGGLGGGYWALALAHGLIAVPVLYLVARSAVHAARPQLDAARDAGASSLRAFVVVLWPRTWAPWGAATLGVLAVLLTRAAPALYVDAPGFPQVGTVLSEAAANADDGTLFVLGGAVLSVGVLLLALLGGIVAARSRYRG